MGGNWAFLLAQKKKESVFKSGDLGSIPAFTKSPGEGNGYPRQYSCLENSKDRGAWRAMVHRVMKRVGYDCVANTFTFISIEATGLRLFLLLLTNGPRTAEGMCISSPWLTHALGDSVLVWRDQNPSFQRVTWHKLTARLFNC